MRSVKSSRVFAVTAVGAFMAMLDLSIVNVAFPDLKASYPQASQASLSWVITAYVIVFGALLVTGGRTADRVGRRRTFMGGLGVFVTASLVCGLAPNLGVLVAGRVVQAAGAAFLAPSSLALLLGAYPPERRTRIVASWGAAGVLAVAAGPSLGATIVSAGGWRWAFLVNVLVGAGVAVSGRRVLTETRAEGTVGRPDYLGTVLITVTVGLLVLAISEGPTWGWGDGRIIAAFAAAAIMGAWFVSRSRTHPEPVVDLCLFGDRSFVTANLASFAYAAGFFAMLLCNILFLTGVWHYSIMAAGLAVTPAPLVVAAVGGPAGRLAGRIGFGPVVAAGAMWFAAGLVWYVAKVDATPAYPSHWLPGTLAVGLGVGLTFPVLSAAAVSSLPAHRYAVGSAVNQTVRQVGGAIGVAVAVMLLDTPASVADQVTRSHHAWTYAAVAAALSGFIGAFIPRPRASSESSTERRQTPDRTRETRRALVISAHPDDIEFGCAGTVRRWVDEGWDVRYVIVTSGQKGTPDCRQDPEALAMQRQKESRDAARVCGVTDVTFLGWMDSDVLFGDGRALRRDLSRQFRLHRPHRLVTMDPGILLTDSFVNHPDHRAVATAALDVTVTGGTTGAIFVELLLDENLPPWPGLEEIWVMGPAGGSTVVDITGTIDHKLAALRAHHSQVGDRRVEAMLRARLADRGRPYGYDYAESFRVICTPPRRASDAPRGPSVAVPADLNLRNYG